MKRIYKKITSKNDYGFYDFCSSAKFDADVRKSVL